MNESQAGRRIQRVEKEIREQMGYYLISGLSEPLPALVTVARVVVSNDLRSGKVFISVLGSEEERKACVEILRRNMPEIQRTIAKKVRMKFFPKLQLISTDKGEEIMRVEENLRKLSQSSNRGPSEES